MSDTQFYEVEKVVGKRMNPHSKKIEYMVKWIGYPETQNTWEPQENLKNSSKFIADYEAEKSKAKKTQKPIIGRPQEKKSRYQRAQEKVDQKKERSISVSSQNLKKKKEKKQMNQVANMIRIEKEINLPPSQIEIVGMGQKKGNIFFRLKSKKEMFWIKKEALIPKYVLGIMEYYEKNLVFV